MAGGMSSSRGTPASHTTEEENDVENEARRASRCWPSRLAAGARRGRRSADSLNRDLQLAPVDTSAALNDRPSGDTATRRARRRRPSPRPRRGPPKPSPSRNRPPRRRPAAPCQPQRRRPRRPRRRPGGLAAGTTFSAATDAEIRSQQEQGGGPGHGHRGEGRQGRRRTGGHSRRARRSRSQVTAIKESENKGDTTGTLTLKPTAIAINGVSKPLPRPFRASRRSWRAGRPTPVISPRWAPGPLWAPSSAA